ncbi:hypothetical protein ACFFRR_011454 [Megaselia abdita]
MKGYKPLVVVVLICLLLHESSAAPWTGTVAVRGRDIRAPFKNTELMTARGFGKRANDKTFGDDGISDDVIPSEWLVKEIRGNPALAKVIVNRFIDLNRDGSLTARELMGTPMELSNSEMF